MGCLPALFCASCAEYSVGSKVPPPLAAVTVMLRNGSETAGAHSPVSLPNPVAIGSPTSLR